MDPFRNGAARVVSSAKLFRPEDFAELTTITASRSRFAPVCGASVASQLLVDAAASSPLRGGEYTTFNSSSHRVTCQVTRCRPVRKPPTPTSAPTLDPTNVRAATPPCRALGTSAAAV